MKSKYHIEITSKALNGSYSEFALHQIIQANVRQDKILNQFGHDYIHFDSSAFEPGYAYISKQKENLINQIISEDFTAARKAFGRITHSWQDFYSHSNYVKLWLVNNKGSSPSDIHILDTKIMDHPDLTSGKNYGIIEFLALIPIISRWIKPIMPEDSHAQMNLDSPNSGNLFNYAYAAALRHTKHLHEAVICEITELNKSDQMVRSFVGQ